MRPFFVLALAAAAALAQEPQQHVFVRSADHVSSTVTIASPSMMMHKEMTGSPYSGTLVTESVQTLADGNRIVNRTEGFMARDSQGRTRTETAPPMLGAFSAKNMPAIVVINDSVAGAVYSLNSSAKTYRKNYITRMKTSNNEPAVEMKRQAEAHASQVLSDGQHASFVFTTADVAKGSALQMKLKEEKAAKFESLGSKMVEGVMADGTRITRTIAAGEIGNERAIEIVSETWFSKEIGTTVLTRTSDPRSGETTRTLTKISRAEPDPALFAPPADYTEASADSIKGTVIYTPKE